MRAGSVSIQVSMLCALSLLMAGGADARGVGGSAPAVKTLPNALPDTVRVSTMPSMLAEDEDDPGSAYLAVGLEDDLSGHHIYLHLDLESLVLGLSPRDLLDVTIDLTTLDGVASDPSQVVAGEHVLIEVDHQSADAVLRAPNYEETSFCHLPTVDESALPASAAGGSGLSLAHPSTLYPPYEAAGEELIHAFVELSYTVNGSGGGSADVPVSIGVYDPALYGGGSALTEFAGEGQEDAPTCMDEGDPFASDLMASSGEESAAGAAQSATQAAKKKWCLSWHSANCYRIKNWRGKKYCPAFKCNISWARLLDIVTSQMNLTPPAAIVASESVKMLSEWLEDNGHATLVTGECADVEFLGFWPVGCQCVFYVF